LGSGIEAEDMEHLFEAFYSNKPQGMYSTKPQGMAMGLRFSRSIVEALGGPFWAAPNAGPGGGVLFRSPG
jgi:signal transduction histidine kinase